MGEPNRDLVERTYNFARDVRALVNRLPRDFSNYEDVRQVVRSSGSVAANYLESQEGLSRKDFFTGSSFAGRNPGNPDYG